MSGDSLQVRTKITRDEGFEWRDLTLKGRLNGPIVNFSGGFCYYALWLHTPLPLIGGMEIDVDPDDLIIRNHVLLGIYSMERGRYCPTPRVDRTIKG